MLPKWLSGKESACQCKNEGLIPWPERFPGVGSDNPPLYSCLENSMDRKAWWATVHRVTESQIRLSD